MVRWACIIATIIIILLGVIECVWHATPFDLVQGKIELKPADSSVTVVRLGVAAWQMDRFPWKETARRYEKAKGGKVRFEISTIPNGVVNTLLLLWRYGQTEYDVLVSLSDPEISPLMDYNWRSKDPSHRSVLVNVRDYLNNEQMDVFVPAFFAGCSRTDPDTGKMNSYGLPWMGEVLALNYNKKFLEERGVNRPPGTWEEVEAACAKLKGMTHGGKKVAPLAMNFDQRGSFAQTCYLPMLAAFKKGRGVEDENGQLDVSSPEAVRVFATLKRWYDAGYISDQAFVIGQVEEDLRVLRAAMYPCWQSRGLWAVADQGADTIGIAPIPGAKEAGALIVTYSCIIPKCSPVAKAAVQICYEAFCSDDYGFQSAVGKGFTLDGKKHAGEKLPTLKRIYDAPDLPPGVAELGKTLDHGYCYPDSANREQCAVILSVEFQKFLSGATPSAEEALSIVRKRFADEVYVEE